MFLKKFRNIILSHKSSFNHRLAKEVKAQQFGIAFYKEKTFVLLTKP